MSRIAREVVSCRRCPRLAAYIGEVARRKRRAYRDWDYWGRPVPGFGDPQARLLIIGLAPAAHGANRTGRMFTGDRSGDWLYRALFQAGFANQPTSRHRDDGLRLQDAYVTALCRCAPPGNKPSRDEIEACSVFLDRELEALTRVRVIVALGQLAFDTILRLMKQRGWDWPVEMPLAGSLGPGSGAGGPDGAPRARSLAGPLREELAAGAQEPAAHPAGGPHGHGGLRKPRFRHAGEYRWLPKKEGNRATVAPAAAQPVSIARSGDRGAATTRAAGPAAPGSAAEPDGGNRPVSPPVLLASYHPSQQNTQTGLLTEPMFMQVFRRARALIDEDLAATLPVAGVHASRWHGEV